MEIRKLTGKKNNKKPSFNNIIICIGSTLIFIEIQIFFVDSDHITQSCQCFIAVNGLKLGLCTKHWLLKASE